MDTEATPSPVVKVETSSEARVEAPVAEAEATPAPGDSKVTEEKEQEKEKENVGDEIDDSDYVFEMPVDTSDTVKKIAEVLPLADKGEEGKMKVSLSLSLYIIYNTHITP